MPEAGVIKSDKREDSPLCSLLDDEVVPAGMSSSRKLYPDSEGSEPLLELGVDPATCSSCKMEKKSDKGGGSDIMKVKVDGDCDGCAR